MKVVGLIPARGNSKGIPGKNLEKIAGRSLIQIAVEEAKACSSPFPIYFSTDSQALLDEGKRFGAHAPFLRPAELSLDDTTMIDVLRHFVEWYSKTEGSEPEAIVLLQPTSPFRKTKHLDQALELFKKSEVDTLVSITPTPHRFSPTSLMLRSDDGMLTSYAKGEVPLRRQDKLETFGRNGPAILITKPAMIRGGSFYSGKTVGFEMDQVASIDIDTPEDLQIARWISAGMSAKG